MVKSEAEIGEKEISGESWRDRLPCQIYVDSEGKELRVYRLTTDGKTSKGNPNNYYGGKPVEALIGTPVIPFVMQVQEKYKNYDLGLPFGCGRIAGMMDGVQVNSFEEVLEKLSREGVDHVFFLGRVTHELSMAGTLLRRGWNGNKI